MALLLYEDSLYFEPLMQEIAGATHSIHIVMYLFKTSYSERTRAHEVMDALIAAAARGVIVQVVLNFCRLGPEVRYANWQTAQALIAGGVHVRFGPEDVTVHAKVAIFDRVRLLTGSHNFTRGGLTYNYELSWFSDSVGLSERAANYFDTVWGLCYDPDEVEAPEPPAGPLRMQLTDVQEEGASIRLTFTANHNQGIDAFAAVAGSDSELSGARIGASVPPEGRAASVVPAAASGEWVFLAVRAYAAGNVVATSGLLQMQYLPTVPSPEVTEPESMGSGEGPVITPLAAPSLTAVTRASDTTVTLTWAFIGAVDFLRFVIEQQDAAGNWQPVITLRNPGARTWTGAPFSMATDHPFHVVVYNADEQRVESNALGLV